MVLSVGQGFDTFLGRLVPTTAQMNAAKTHRSRVETSLENSLTVKRFRETGSFHHGTGVRHHCDVDLLASLSDKPSSSDTALTRVKNALLLSFPTTPVYVSRPAVVVDFASGAERWEILPGYLRSRSDGDPYVYDIPGPAGGWITSAPVEHLKYVNTVNGTAGITGAAKKLARLAKAWKYYNNVPMSSFYLEMRAAKYMSTQSSFVAVYDICYLLEELHSSQLAGMNDPSEATGRFYACSSEAKATDALSKLSTGATRARKALDAYREGNETTAFYYLDLLFGGMFPAR